ncbi:MAG: hypothetical protein WA058_01245 [Minisyncoccia bacterium]
MSWAARRRFIILLIIGAVVVAIIAIISFATFSKAPTCTDGIQNQNEDGIDCGGPCAYLCLVTEQPPTVLFTKALNYGSGRTDIIASVENKNATAAAKDVPYHITLFGAGQALIQEVNGTLDLPPGATVPVYIPGIDTGKQTVTRAFLSIAASAPAWFSMVGERNVPLASNIRQSGSVDAPRIEATLSNSTTIPFNNVQVIVIVRNAAGDVIAASQTVLPSIPSQGQTNATFTWNKAFSDTPTAIQVVPNIPLP